jgi:heptosyltransferase-2
MPAIKKYYLALREAILFTLVRTPHSVAMGESISAILVISEPRLGDVSLAIPALRELRAAFPGATLGIVASRSLHPLLQWGCGPDILLDYSQTEQVRKRKWDVAIDLSGDYHLRSALTARSSRAPLRIGFEFAGRGCFFTVALPLRAAEHTAKRYMRAFEKIGVRSCGEIQARARSLLPGPGRVGIHPGAHHATQRWPAAYYADLIRKINQTGAGCVVLGARSEWHLVEQVVELSAGAATAIHTGGVMDLVENLRSLNLLVCNNSGPLHLAGLLGVPTLSFMGPTVKAGWWPLGAGSIVLRRDELPCIGCNQGRCKLGTRACMTEISPDTAFEAFLRLRAGC